MTAWAQATRWRESRLAAAPEPSAARGLIAAPGPTAARRSIAAPGPKAARGLTVAIIAAFGAACENASDDPESPAQVQRETDSVSTVTIRRPANDGEGQAQSAGQRADAPPQQSAQQGREPSGEASSTGDVAQQAAASVEDTVELGTFSPTTPPSGVDAQAGRLPAPGDLAIYVPNTTLFPGGARLDPEIENPYSGDATAIAAGERHFNAFNCSGCHAPLGGGGMGPPLTDDDWIHGSEPAQMYLTIMHGRPDGMPAFGSMLPRRTAWEIVAYVETLSEIDNYATHLGFDAEHATSVTLESRYRAPGGEREQEQGQQSAQPAQQSVQQGQQSAQQPPQ